MRRQFTVQIKTSELPLTVKDKTALRGLDKFDWILFTSKHAVTYFKKYLRTKKSGAKIAAVGPVTAKALKKIGRNADVISPQMSVETLVESIGAVGGKRILFPRSAIAPHTAVAKLRKMGARVTVVKLYMTLPAPLSAGEKKALLDGKYSSLMFKSPSGVKGFMGQFARAEKDKIRRLPASCLGQTTAEALRAAGFAKIEITLKKARVL